MFLFLGQLWQLFEVSQILEFLRYILATDNSTDNEDCQLIKCSIIQNKIGKSEHFNSFAANIADWRLTSHCHCC